MKAEQRLKTIRDILLSLIAVMVFAIALGYFCNFYYDLNDDVLMKDILSGTYTGIPEARNIQMLYPAGLLVSMLYRLIPTLPWYGIFLCFCHFICAVLIAKRMISFAAGVLKKGLLLLLLGLLFCALILYELVFVQYTVTAAMLAATGIFLYYTTDDKLESGAFIRRNIVSVILIVLAFYIRTEMVLLLFPLIGAAGLAKWIFCTGRSGAGPFRVQNLLKYLTPLILVLIGMAVGLIANAIAYSGLEWGKFMTFFDYRTELYDFQGQPPEYDENQLYYENIGLSYAQEQLLINYNFALDEEIDEALLTNIVNYNRVYLKKDYFRNDLGEALRLYLYRLTHREDQPWVYLIWLLYLLIIVTGFLHKQYTVVLKLIPLALMRSVSWMYLIMRGRMVDRVNNSLYLAEALILGAMLFMECRYLMQSHHTGSGSQDDPDEAEGKAAHRLPQYCRLWPLTAAALVGVLLAVPAVRAVDKVNNEQERRIQVNREWELLRDYFAEHTDNYYLLDVYSTVSYSEPMFVGVDNSYRNFDICGGWAAKSPIYAQKLAVMGIGNLQSDLMNMNNVYFVTRIDRDMDWFVAYYRSKGYEVRLDTEKAFRVDGKIRFMIYHVRLFKVLE